MQPEVGRERIMRKSPLPTVPKREHEGSMPVISLVNLLREGVPRSLLLGLFLIVSVTACETHEPNSPVEGTLEPEQYKQPPSAPQANTPNTPVKHVVHGYASPEEAYAKCEEARKQRNWVTTLDCLTTSAQDDTLLKLHVALKTLLRMETLAAGFGTRRADSITDDSKKILIRALEASYAKVETGKTDTSTVLPTKYEYFGDIMEFLSRYGQGKEPQRQSLVNVAIEGDTARGTTVETYKNGKEQRNEIQFKRVNGEWFKHVMGEH